MIGRKFLALALAGFFSAPSVWAQTPCATQFSDSNYLVRGGALTGVVDGQTGIFSAWVKSDNTTAYRRVISQDTGGQHFKLQRATGQAQFQLYGANSTGTRIMLGYSSVYTADYSWFHILASWDLSVPVIHYYINDVSDNVAPQAVDDTMDYTHGDWVIGADVGGGNQWNGAIAQLYFAPNQYLDFSVESNRRLFIKANLKPVNLGPTGAKPTGTSPAIYLNKPFSSSGKNKGTGGNFAPQATPLWAAGPSGTVGECSGRVIGSVGERVAPARTRGGRRGRGGRHRQ